MRLLGEDIDKRRDAARPNKRHISQRALEEMTVYVDTLDPPLGKAARCHVMADSTAELTDALAAAGVDPVELVRPGTAWEHVLVPFATGEAMVEAEIAEAVTVDALDALARGRR